MSNLIDINTYKIAKGMTSAKDDEHLSALVASVSQLVKTYCGVSFVDYVTEPYTEYVDVYWDTKEIQLTESPLIAIQEVWVKEEIEEDYVILEETEYSFSRRTDMLKRKYYPWPLGLESVKVIYTAGYSEVPEDLKLALVDLIGYYHKEEYKSSKVLSGAQVNNQTSSSIKGDTGFPNHIKRVLDMYRQV